MPHTFRFVPRLLALLLSLAAGAALAQPNQLPPSSQTIYKVQMPDGSIVFTDSVPRGAKVLEQRENKPQVTIPSPSSRPAASAAPAKGTIPTALDKAIAEVDAAERALADAKLALDQAREPQEGDRIGLKGGGSRLSPEYEERLRRLELRVTDAEERVRKAYEARNSAR